MPCFAVPGEVTRLVTPAANYWAAVTRMTPLLTVLQLGKSICEPIKLFLLEFQHLFHFQQLTHPRWISHRRGTLNTVL